jgi:hypothetical protein
VLAPSRRVSAGASTLSSLTQAFGAEATSCLPRTASPARVADVLELLAGVDGVRVARAAMGLFGFA